MPSLSKLFKAILKFVACGKCAIKKKTSLMFCMLDSNCIISVVLEYKSQLISGDKKNTTYTWKNCI